MKNKIEIKNFLGMEVRILNGEYIVLKDMFSALGRLDSKCQIVSADSKKLNEFLNDIDKTCDHKTFTITSKSSKNKSRETQEIKCLKLDCVPIVLTQFKPTKARGEEALRIWSKFMKFVDNMLRSLEVYKYIIVDKDKQKSNTDVLIENGGTPIIANKMTNGIMAELMNVYPEIKQIKKDELKIYQNQTTIDLLEVRDFVYSKFINAYEFTGSHKTSKEMSLKLAKKKYNL
ncbi:UNVERIFIED_ORG: hypothetical protein B2H93_04675 [Clostridium botulinum]